MCSPSCLASARTHHLTRLLAASSDSTEKSWCSPSSINLLDKKKTDYLQACTVDKLHMWILILHYLQDSLDSQLSVVCFQPWIIFHPSFVHVLSPLLLHSGSHGDMSLSPAVLVGLDPGPWTLDGPLFAVWRQCRPLHYCIAINNLWPLGITIKIWKYIHIYKTILVGVVLFSPVFIFLPDDPDEFLSSKLDLLQMSS